MIKKRKKILVVSPGNLFPTTMMSQRRVLNQINSLVKRFDVDLATFDKNKNIAQLTQDSLKGIVNSFHSINAINYDHNPMRKYFYNLKFHFNYKIRGIRIAVSNFSSRYARKNLVKIINQNNYDIIISHYWWGSFFFKEKIDYQPIKILDLHSMVDEDIILNSNSTFYRDNHELEKRVNKNNLKFQKEVYQHVDLLVPNSKKQVEIISEHYNTIKHYYCPNGQEISYFNKFISDQYDPKTILFYGSIGGLQNRRGFELFYNKVWPLILAKEENARLLIVGNKPPENILALNNLPNVTVTGYVEEVGKYISKANCMVLPMDIGVGFRGRVIEVMATGVPVIGNHNALDCIGMENGINGYVTDDYQELADYAVEILNNKDLRRTLSKNSVKFVDQNYSFNATFDKLSEYLENLT